MRRNGLYSLIFIVVLAVAGLSVTFAADNEPLLGLDLQGGVSVVLQPTEDVSDEALGEAIEIIRRRVDSLGVAEPDIARQGDAIVVQLPGIDDRDRALELVGQTAELRFRPVLQNIPQQLWGVDEEGLEDLQSTTTTTAPPPSQPSNEEMLEQIEPTPPAEAEAEEEVTLSQLDGDTEVARFRLGPTEATGEILSTASAELAQGTGTWRVAVDIDGGALDQFNEIAARCFNQDPTCPTGQLAIVLDGRVQSAPRIQEPTFGSEGVSITGDFSEGEAKDLALVLRYGALPIELEPQQTRSVSATIGQDALDAGVTAGFIGLALVAVYILAYYRLLGMVAILSLTLSGALLWTVVAYLGDSQGLALTLAGVTGLIVSVGVAVDSNVVFYEHLKEAVARGRTMRASIDSSFTSAFSTIVKADIASLIGAGILYWLTVGPVRGFAFFLGLGTLIDLVASWFFMRPLSLMLVKSERFQRRPSWFGMPTRRGSVPDDAQGVPA